MITPCHVPNEVEGAKALLARMPSSPSLLEIVSIRGGRNNRVWRASTTDGPFLLKQYFTHPNDNRDRLARETEFLTFSREAGCLQVPECFVFDASSRFALLEWIEGTTPTSDSVDANAIDQAAAFFTTLNAKREHAEFRLKPASEACFSLQGHLALVENRLTKLASLDCSDDLDREATAFVQNKVHSVWTRAAARISAAANTVLSSPERCLSPSDFGFHNSIREGNGRLRFIDFEYAGWDDPAKLVCDFANQPDMLLPVSLSDRFRQAVTSLFPKPAALDERIRLLEPVLQVKWCCICLNVFLGTGRDRARFTDGREHAGNRQRMNQLARARTMLQRAINTL
ncbi:aminoglycoside phosphotransferase family protein [Nibricoccus sp. IMCC34717]|uniref:aminoglycoside phosphotransferase family protein n=1 Tax=Nibricoccus sp. IMCC34717 TaxID=3034021 RepID=UPI00384F8921